MRSRRRPLLVTYLAVVMAAGCTQDIVESTSGPWLGSWVQVNFLATDDNGVWDEDDLTGIGFVQTITGDAWVLTDGYGSGCAITFSYTIRAGDRFSRQATAAGSGCPPSVPLGLLQDSGRLEFSSDNRFMIEWYDPVPGDEIVAFKWVLR
jgi:hypothetical protein